jgi:hypothetical protein
MVYLGDGAPAEATTYFNQLLDDYNAELRAGYRQAADVLFETRWVGGPFDQARYPDYLRARFFSTEGVNGISNSDTWIDEPAEGPVPHQKIHYSAAATRIHAVHVAEQLLKLRR